MKENQQAKEYKTPLFHLVRRDEQNTVFFTASEGGPAKTTATGSLGTSTWE